MILTVLGGSTVAGTSAGARSIPQPRTLVSTGHRIRAFALGAGRLTWIGEAQVRGPRSNCGMYVRKLRTGKTSIAPLPRTGCGATSHRLFAPQVPVLASGVAAWITGFSCGNNECFWSVAMITAGAKRARTIERTDIGCDYVCDGGAPGPALAGAGSVLVFSAGGGGGPALYSDRVKSVVGRRTLFTTGGNVESLAVRGGAIEAVSRVLVRGDGCGCLDSPAWSPDGSRIAYFDGGFWNQQIDPQPPDAALAVMNADGSGRHDLTPRNTLGAGPTWSPDGRRIAFAEQSRTNPFPEVIVVANADGSGSLQLGPGDDPAWSPDGSKIAFASAGCGGSVAAISTMSPDGSNIHQLASFGPGPSCLGEGGMAWSPDGNRIAFSLNGTLEEMNADGSNAHPLGTNIVGDEPAWSADSNQIVFREAGGLWEIGADGSGLHQLTSGPDEHPSWSPNGATIVFGSDRNDPYVSSGETYDGASPELYLVDPDGSNLRPLTFTKPSAFEEQTTYHTANGRPLPALPGLPALAGHIAAVGSTSARGHQIALFEATTGAQIAAVPVGRGGGVFVVAGGDTNWVVFRVGRSISALDVHSRKVVRLTTTPVVPLDLSVAGRRVAWAENIRGHGRIRALELPS